MPNTTELMLAIPVHEMTDDGDNSKCTDVTFVPIAGWMLEKLHDNLPVQINPVAVGSDNGEGMKIAYNKTTDDWFICNGQQQGCGKDDLIKLFNINNFLNEDVENDDE